MEASTHRQIVVDQQGPPEGIRRLLALAAAVPEREGRPARGRTTLLARQHQTAVLAAWQGAWDMLGFIGEAISPASGW